MREKRRHPGFALPGWGLSRFGDLDGPELWTDDMPAMSQTASVLLIEDDHDTLNAIVAVLERLGLAVVTANNGEEAIRQLDRGLRPHLILADLMLPKVSGWDLLQYLREQPELRQIPTVVMTGFPRENLRVAADVVLHKPVDYDRLINTVRNLIEPGSRRGTRTAVV